MSLGLKSRVAFNSAPATPAKSRAKSNFERMLENEQFHEEQMEERRKTLRIVEELIISQSLPELEIPVREMITLLIVAARVHANLVQVGEPYNSSAVDNGLMPLSRVASMESTVMSDSEMASKMQSFGNGPPSHRQRSSIFGRKFAHVFAVNSRVTGPSARITSGLPGMAGIPRKNPPLATIASGLEEPDHGFASRMDSVEEMKASEPVTSAKSDHRLTNSGASTVVIKTEPETTALASAELSTDLYVYRRHEFNCLRLVADEIVVSKKKPDKKSKRDKKARKKRKSYFHRASVASAFAFTLDEDSEESGSDDFSFGGGGGGGPGLDWDSKFDSPSRISHALPDLVPQLKTAETQTGVVKTQAVMTINMAATADAPHSTNDLRWYDFALDESTEKVAFVLSQMPDSELLYPIQGYDSWAKRFEKHLGEIKENLRMMGKQEFCDDTLISNVIRGVALETLISDYIFEQYPILDLTVDRRKARKALTNSNVNRDGRNPGDPDGWEPWMQEFVLRRDKDSKSEEVAKMIQGMSKAGKKKKDAEEGQSSPSDPNHVSNPSEAQSPISVAETPLPSAATTIQLAGLPTDEDDNDDGPTDVVVAEMPKILDDLGSVDSVLIQETEQIMKATMRGQASKLDIAGPEPMGRDASASMFEALAWISGFDKGCGGCGQRFRDEEQEDAIAFNGGAF